MRSSSAFVFVVLLSTSWAVSARAEGPPSADHDAAVTEFTAGRTLFEAGDCKGAIPRFVASLKREQSVGARFNLAECSAREGRTAEAWNHFKAAEQLAIRKGDTKRVEVAHAAAADLDRKVTKVRLVLPSDVASLTLKIDGVEVDVTDHWLLSTGYALEPGKAHTLAAESPGKKAWMRSDVKGDPGVELPAMVVDFGRPKDASVPPPPEKTPALRTASYIVGGVGLAALATGGVFGILASSSKSTAESECTDGAAGFSYPSLCNPARKSQVDDANGRATTQATIATIGVISGAVLVSAAAVMFFVSRGKSPTTTGSSTTFRSISTSGPGALLSGSF
jgi:hypothetical protein